MNYGRETVGKALRKAGDVLRDFDQDYSYKILDRYVDANDPNPNQIKGAIGMFAGGTPINLGYTPSDPSFTNKARISSAVAKYVLPAAGVTLAGKGLIDIAGAIGQQTNGTLEP